MSAPARRLLSVAGFWLVNAAIAALVWIALVEPVAAWFRAQSDDLEEKSQLLSRYERALSRGDADRPAPAGVLVPGATDAVRAAALQETVKRAAGASGARVLSVSTLPAAREQPGLVALRVDLAGPMKAVTQTIARIENGTPMVAVSRATIRASASREEAAGDQTPLDVQIDIVGFGAR